jgi:hypothetical protein
VFRTYVLIDRDAPTQMPSLPFMIGKLACTPLLPTVSML